MSFIASGTVSGPRFSGAMRWVAKTGSFDDRHIVENYPWDDFGEGTVVDVRYFLILHDACSFGDVYLQFSLCRY